MEKALVQFDRLENLVKETGKKKKFLCNLVGRGEYYINDAKTKGIYIPIEFIKIWADELNTTVDYLTGKSDIKEKPPATAGDIRKQAEELIGKMNHDQLLEFIAKATEKLREK